MEHLITIIALVVGWSLNEASHYIRTSKEHKAAIANALSILLEVRFQAVGINCVMNELKTRGAPDEIIPVIRILLDTVIPNSTALDDEYTESMKTVAKTAPLLAYEYRSRNTIPSFLRNWRSMASEQGMPLKEIEEMESQLNSMIIPRLNELIIHLAEVHSKKSTSAVAEILKNPVEMPKGFSEFLKNVEQKANEQG